MFRSDIHEGEEWNRRRVAGVALLAGCAAVLAVAWLWILSDAKNTEGRCKQEEDKLKRVKLYIEKNYERLLGPPEEEKVVSPLRKQPLLSIVKDVSAECGLSDRLQRVVEEENKKLGERTAKVTFRRIRMADVVNFLSIAKKEFPGLWDREARMRHAKGGEADSWDVTLSLTARKP